MNNYELHYVELRVVKHPGIVFFEQRVTTFEEETFDDVLQGVKEFLKEKKRSIIRKLDSLTNDENADVKITKDEKENLLKKYPTNFILIETITHSVEIEEY